MKPGRKGRRGSITRRATSHPATTDSHKKRRTSAGMAAGWRRTDPAGRRCRLVHVAAAAVTSPTTRSPRVHADQDEPEGEEAGGDHTSNNIYR